MTKTIIITGGSDGIGLAAARELKAQGHTVVLIGRSPEKTKQAAIELSAPYYIADFADLCEVRALAEAIQRDYDSIDVLALNAGGIFSERELTKDGFERTFQVNHLAHFLLVTMLKDTLQKSNTTVIATSSAAHLMNRLDLDDLNASKRYGKWTVYGNAKLMNILMVRELHTRFGIPTAAFHPGVVATSFARDLSPFLKRLFSSRVGRLFGLITPREGADTLVWLATAEPDGELTGTYYAKRKPAYVHPKARNESLARELWDKSTTLLAR